MKRLTFFWMIMMTCLPLLLKAQGQAVVSGTVTDRTAGEPLPAATVSIAPASDTSAKTYTSTDGEGAFAFRSMAVGSYVVSVSYVGFKPMEKRVKVIDSKQTYSLRFVLEEDAQVLGEVSVQGRATRAEQRGDSLQYNAEAFQVMEGSSAEDLLANYANVPTIFDGVESRTRVLNLIPKVIIGSNISKNLDFTASYSAGINKMFSSLDTATGSDYVTHTAAAKLGWTFFWGLTFRSTFNYIGYTGLDTGTEDYFLWNLSLGKKFLKNNAAEIRLEAFDVLKQNQAFTHRTGSNYYDYVNSNVLQPYAMVTFVYTIR